MERENTLMLKQLSVCPACNGTNIIKRGIRKKKLEQVQIYFCKNCNKRFTSNMSKNTATKIKKAVIFQKP